MGEGDQIYVCVCVCRFHIEYYVSICKLTETTCVALVHRIRIDGTNVYLGRAIFLHALSMSTAHLAERINQWHNMHV